MEIALADSETAGHQGPLLTDPLSGPLPPPQPPGIPVTMATLPLGLPSPSTSMSTSTVTPHTSSTETIQAERSGSSEFLCLHGDTHIQFGDVDIDEYLKQKDGKQEVTAEQEKALLESSDELDSQTESEALLHTALRTPAPDDGLGNQGADGGDP